MAQVDLRLFVLRWSGPGVVDQTDPCCAALHVPFISMGSSTKQVRLLLTFLVKNELQLPRHDETRSPLSHRAALPHRIADLWPGQILPGDSVLGFWPTE